MFLKLISYKWEITCDGCGIIARSITNKISTMLQLKASGWLLLNRNKTHYCPKCASKVKIKATAKNSKRAEKKC